MSRSRSFPLGPALGLCAAASLVALLPGCTREGCLDGSEGCRVPSPCRDVSFSCDERQLSLRVLGPGDAAPGGLDALAAEGDIVLDNGVALAVIDALDNANFVSTSGGMLLDLATAGDDNDAINHVFQVTGALPEDGVVYEKMELIEEPGLKAVQFLGHLAGDARHRVATRYEMRACDPGLRVRTEMVNTGPDEVTWMNGDAYWWGKRENLPFAPAPGGGYKHPAFGLSTLNDAFRKGPFFAAATFAEPAASYATVSCNAGEVEMLHSQQVSAVGSPRTVLAPGDYLVYERMHLVGKGMGAQPAADLAYEVRRQLHDEPFAEVSGLLVVEGAPGSAFDANRASVTLLEGRGTDPVPLLTPRTHAVPDENGIFHARVPDGRDYVLEVSAFGRVVARREVSVQGDVDVGAVTIPGAGALTVSVAVQGEGLTDAQVFVYAADDETRAEVKGRFAGVTDLCAPLLGYPYGASPACNRFLVKDPVTVDLPAGRYDVYATLGPFAQLGHRSVDVTEGSHEELVFDLARLPVLPDGVLSADFHVHGAASFDSSIPDLTRVSSFLAQSVDVIAATDHDAIYDYADALEALDVGDRLVLLTGLETTAFVLFRFNPEVTYPQVIGHWNFWPLRYRPERPRNGAPVDEQAEPGLLFTRVKQAELPEWGVIQLNHPWAELEFGRDLGFPRALQLKFNEPLPLFDDGSAAALFLRKPEGSEFHNSDYHTQEVMNGTDNTQFLQYRAFWFYLLNQGVVRAGTANSDSHSLTDNIVGTPRTLVFTETTKADFDPVRFNTDVQQGHMVGTNGPVIDARVSTSNGTVYRPSVNAFQPGEGARLHVVVRSSPWVVVDEIRVIVNGKVGRVIREGISNSATPFSSSDLVRFEGELSLDDLLPPGDADAWIVVEAGSPLPVFGDVDCDGVPDTGDNNGDGVVDWRDVDRDGDGRVSDSDHDIDGDGRLSADDVVEPCAGPTGPLENPPAPEVDDPRHPFTAVTPGGYPLSFTNPFLVDRDGSGFQGPGIAP